MKLGQSGISNSNSGHLFKLADVAERELTIISARLVTQSQYGPFYVWSVDNSLLGLSYVDDEGNEVTPDVISVGCNADNVPGRTVADFFKQYPNETCECVIFKSTSNNGREYWDIADYDEWQGDDGNPFSDILSEPSPSVSKKTTRKSA